MPFEQWENGEELFTSLDRDVDLLDRDLRLWAEECDQMQGIKIYTGADDAWGGFASRYTERLRDEYGKLAIWIWGIEDAGGNGSRAQKLLRSLNVAKTIHDTGANASMYIPLSLPPAPLLPYVKLDRHSQWHVSALLSAVVENVTLPSRTKAGVEKCGLLGDLEAVLNGNGHQRIAQLQCSFLQPETKLPRDSAAHSSMDSRAPSTIKHAVIFEDEAGTTDTTLDIDLSGGDQRIPKSSANLQRTPDHVFGAVEVIRSQENEAQDETTEERESSNANTRRRFAGLSVIERSVVMPMIFRVLTKLQVQVYFGVPTCG